MKITIKDVVDTRITVGELLKQKLPIKIAYRISKLANKLASEYKFYEEKRLELVKEYGEKVKDDEGNETDNIQVTKKNETKFYEELNKIVDLEVEIDYDPISIEELGNIQIEPKLLNPILFKD